MATGYINPPDSIEYCEVYHLNGDAAATHTLTIPSGTRAMIMLMRTSYNHSAIIYAVCLSNGTVNAMNASAIGNKISIDTATANKLKITNTDSVNYDFNAVVIQYGIGSRITI